MATDYLYMDFLLGYKEYFNLTDSCTGDDVVEIERKLTVKFPRSYREVYLILGEEYGFSLIDDESFQFPDYEERRRSVEKMISLRKIDFVLDKNIFIVGCFEENGIFYFFKLDEGDDPPVYRFGTGDAQYKLAAESCSSFVQQRNWYKSYLLLKERKESGRL